MQGVYSALPGLQPTCTPLRHARIRTKEDATDAGMHKRHCTPARARTHTMHQIFTGQTFADSMHQLQAQQVRRYCPTFRRQRVLVLSHYIKPTKNVRAIGTAFISRVCFTLLFTDSHFVPFGLHKLNHDSAYL